MESHCRVLCRGVKLDLKDLSVLQCRLEGKEQLGSHCNSLSKNNHCFVLELVVIMKVEMNGSKYIGSVRGV